MLTQIYVTIWCHAIFYAGHSFNCFCFIFQESTEDCPSEIGHSCWFTGYWKLLTTRCESQDYPLFPLSLLSLNTMRRCYNTVKFLPNPHNRHPIAHPRGLHMGCLLWVWSLIYIRCHYSALWYIVMHSSVCFDGLCPSHITLPGYALNLFGLFGMKFEQRSTGPMTRPYIFKHLYFRVDMRRSMVSPVTLNTCMAEHHRAPNWHSPWWTALDLPASGRMWRIRIGSSLRAYLMAITLYLTVR